ncbi:MAG: hypothetical protein JST62_00660 [Bacteroidetes bacterium]|jgi:hypothetical protein|nr:hypothetical protein [Bacteroidota bacterium]
MLEFIHHKVSVINGFLSKFNTIQTLYLDKSYLYETELQLFLKNLQYYFSEISDSTKESEVLKYSGMLQTIKKGFDPIKLEKIATARRDFFWGMAFHINQEIQQLLVNMLASEEQKLSEADDLLSNTFLSLIQNQILSNQELKKLNNTIAIELFWTSIVKQNTTIAVLDKKMKMKITAEDIYLLIEKIVVKIS